MAFGGVALALVDAISVAPVRVFNLPGAKSVFVSSAVLAFIGYVGYSSSGVFNSLSVSNDGPRVIVDRDWEFSNVVCAMFATIPPGRKETRNRSTVGFGGWRFRIGDVIKVSL